MKSLVLKLMLATQFVMLGHLAVAGDSIHGEDPEEAVLDRNKEDVRELLPTLKNELLKTLALLGQAPSKTSVPYGQIRDMVTKGLKNDIGQSPYEIREDEPCEEEVLKKDGKPVMGKDGKPVKKPVPASAKLNDMGGKICFSIRKLSEAGINTVPELVRTALHEHSHHFGYLDADSIKIGTFIWKFAELTQKTVAQRNQHDIVTLPYGLDVPIEVVLTAANFDALAYITEMQTFETPEVMHGFGWAYSQIPHSESVSIDPRVLQGKTLNYSLLRHLAEGNQTLLKVELYQGGKLLFARKKDQAVFIEGLGNYTLLKGFIDLTWENKK